LPTLAGGRYPLTLVMRRGAHEVSQRTTELTIPGADAEPQEEFEADGPNLPLLQQLTAATGGAMDAPVRQLVSRQPGSRRFDEPLDWFLVPAALLLFLADVGLRRLSRPLDGGSRNFP
jgi:hypothetical protein